MITILLDGDEIAYKSSAPSSIWQKNMGIYRTKTDAMADNKEGKLYNYQVQPFKKSVTTQIDSMIKKVKTDIDALSCEESKIIAVVSGKGNFRRDMYDSYKANRDGRPRPAYLQFAKSYILSKYNGIESQGEEADDVISYMNEQLDNSIIASSDKDFLTCVGTVFNIMKCTLFIQDEFEAAYNFWKQVLIGDRIDGVFGLYGVGPVKAGKILATSQNTADMASAVRAEYCKHDRLGDLQKNGFCLHLRKFPGEMWKFEDYLDDVN